MKITVEEVIAHALEVEVEDPIDWGLLAIDEYSTYHMLASSILEHYESMEPENRDLMMLSIATKLVVENFVLNLRLQKA